MKNSQHLADPWVQPSFKTFESHESCIFCAEGLRVRSERSQEREREKVRVRVRIKKSQSELERGKEIEGINESKKERKKDRTKHSL